MVRCSTAPENLAYKGQARAPAGMLVFDVELIKIR
jgi:FKBP-type peptidyl-prolyl cis-trans isomerase